MKTLALILAAMLVTWVAAQDAKLPVTSAGGGIAFSVPVPTAVTTTNAIVYDGAFWTAWERATNAYVPTPTIGGVNGYITFNATNYIDIGLLQISEQGTLQFNCPKPHRDDSMHTDTLYVTSNLVAYLVWRGQTNRQILEVVPVTNIVKQWKYEQVRKDLP